MEKELNIILRIYYLNVSIKLEKEVEREKNLRKMVNYYLKENIKTEKDGMEKQKNILEHIIM